MNTNRIVRIVNRIAKKRIALEQSPYSFVEMWELGRKDPDAEVFLYDDIVTGEIHRGNFPANSHGRLVGIIYDENKEKIKELEKSKKIYSEDDLYRKVIRGYWFPEMGKVFFHGNPNEEQVSEILSKMNVDVDKEEIYSI